MTNLFPYFLAELLLASNMLDGMNCRSKHPQQPEIHVNTSQFVSLNIGVCKVSFTIQSSSMCFWLGIPALTCFLQRFPTEIIAKYFKALDTENIFLTLHHYTFFERGNEPSVSIIGLTHTIGQQANNFHLCIPRPIPFV